MSESLKAFTNKIVKDIDNLVRADNMPLTFEIIPTPDENKNKSPIRIELNSFGLESWAVKHVVLYSHQQVLKDVPLTDVTQYMSYLLAVNLLNPDMSTAWNRRKWLMKHGKTSAKLEMKITQLALSRSPKCNDAFAHRRWMIKNRYVTGDDKSILREELEVALTAAVKYPCNYHAWDHCQWCLRHLAPSLQLLSTSEEFRDLALKSSFPLYENELEKNAKFVSSHVSDCSALHFRSFLLNQILNDIENHENVRDGSKPPENQPKFSFDRIKDELSDFAGDSSCRTCALCLSNDNALSRDQIKISILLREITENDSLSETFQDHEALWCFRKFLIFSLYNVIKEVKSRHADVCNAIWMNIEKNEIDKVSSNYRRKESYAKVFKNYSSWLGRVIGIKIDLSST